MIKDQDKKIIDKIKKGNKQAFDFLFRKYYTQLCRYSLKFLKDKQKSEETVQEVFIKIWEQRNKLNFNYPVNYYLFKAVKNNSLNHLKKENTRKEYEKNFSISYIEKSEEFEKNKENIDLSSLITSMIEKLPPKCKEIFNLNRHEGLTYGEIANFLNVSEKTVENQIAIAFKKLRKELIPLLSKIYLLIFVIF